MEDKRKSFFFFPSFFSLSLLFSKNQALFSLSLFKLFKSTATSTVTSIRDFLFQRKTWRRKEAVRSRRSPPFRRTKTVKTTTFEVGEKLCRLTDLTLRDRLTELSRARKALSSPHLPFSLSLFLLWTPSERTKERKRPSSSSSSSYSVAFLRISRPKLKYEAERRRPKKKKKQSVVTSNGASFSKRSLPSFLLSLLLTFFLSPFSTFPLKEKVRFRPNQKMAVKDRDHFIVYVVLYTTRPVVYLSDNGT